MNVQSRTVVQNYLFAQNTLEQETPVRLGDIRDAALAGQAMYFAQVGKMTAGLMHDLRNRMTIALGFLNFAMKDLPPDPKDQQDCLKKVLGSLLDALQLMESAKSLAPGQSLRKVPWSINEIAETAAQKVETSGEFDLCRVHISREYDLSLPKVMAHPVHMERVFVNLIRNACQAMQENGGNNFLIKTFRIDGNVCILLRDSGPGLPEAVLQNLGAPFNSTREQLGGSGLGLMVACDIVKAHGGKLIARNHPLIGAEFFITLPHSAPAQSAGPEPGRRQFQKSQTAETLIDAREPSSLAGKCSMLKSSFSPE